MKLDACPARRADCAQLDLAERRSASPPVWARLRDKLREVGPLYLAQLIVQRAFVPRMFDVGWRVIVALDLRSLPQEVPDDSIREVTTNDLEQFSQFGEHAEVVGALLRSGLRAWVMEREGRWLGYDGLGLPVKTVSPWLFIEGRAGDVWGGFIKIRDDSRGQGLGPRLRRHVAREGARVGYTRMLGVVDGLNRNSQRALSRTGFAPLGSLFFVSLLGVTLIRHGRSWRIGFWSACRPLQFSVVDTVR